MDELGTVKVPFGVLVWFTTEGGEAACQSPASTKCHETDEYFDCPDNVPDALQLVAAVGEVLEVALGERC